MNMFGLKTLKRWQLCLPMLLMAVFAFSSCEDDNGTETINPVYAPGETVVLNGAAQDDDVALTSITDRNWTISVPETAPWLTVIKMGGNKVRIRVTENADADAAYRSAVVDIVGSKYIEQISVAQDVLRYVDVGDNQDVNLDPEGETDHTVPITSNVWETGQTPVYTLQKSEGSDWLTADIDGTDLLLSAGDNSAGTSMLTASVTVSATTVFGEVISRTIQVNQDTERSIELGDDVVMDRKGETVYIPITSNVGNLGATISNMLGSWLTATIQTGKLVLQARPFTNGTQPRSAVVTVTGTTSVGVEIMDQVIVTQDIVRYLSFGDDPAAPVNDYTLATTGGDENVNISTNVETSSLTEPLVVILTGDADWLTASITGGVLTLSAGDNSTGTVARTATVTTTGTSIYGERITSNTMTVTQNMAPYVTIDGASPLAISPFGGTVPLDISTNANPLTLVIRNSGSTWLNATIVSGKLSLSASGNDTGNPLSANVYIDIVENETILESSNTITVTQAAKPNYDITTLPGGTNSYMVAPPANNTDKMMLYKFPITRVNEYWGSPTLGNTPAKVIGTDTKWVAELIWQDVDVDFTGNVFNLYEEFVSGTGPDAMIGFYLKNYPADQYGNVLVGIKLADADGNATGDYLWSWHIWITDFDATVAGNTYTYLGGSTIGNVTIMDRNLGAKNKLKTGTGSFGLFYQWGRKDPFVGPGVKTPNGEVHSTIGALNEGVTMSRAPYYLARTNSVITEGDPNNYVAYNLAAITTAGGSVKYSIANPNTFIRGTSSTNNPYHWYMDSYADADRYGLWSSTTKTIYDPCPNGWRIPNRYSFTNAMAAANITIDATNAGMTTSLGDWYPTSGMMFYGSNNASVSNPTASIIYVGTRGFFHTAYAGTTSTPYCAAYPTRYYMDGTVSTNSNQYLATGFPTRCMKIE